MADKKGMNGFCENQLHLTEFLLGDSIWKVENRNRRFIKLSAGARTPGPGELLTGMLGVLLLWLLGVMGLHVSGNSSEPSEQRRITQHLSFVCLQGAATKIEV